MATSDQERNRYKQVTGKQVKVAGMAGMLWQLNWQHRPSGKESLKTDMYVHNGADEEQLGRQVTESGDL